jgi:hypothetical protein
VSLVLALASGIVLAASAGLRAFMPLLGLGLASRFLEWPMSPALEWMGSDAGLVTLSVATVVELVADKVPVVDNVLDIVHTVMGPLAGALAAFGVLGELPVALAAVIALGVGAPVAGGVHAVAATTRVKSTALTGGAANPAVSVAEDGISVGAIVVALVVPVLAVVLAAITAVFVVRFVTRPFGRSAR